MMQNRRGIVMEIRCWNGSCDLRDCNGVIILYFFTHLGLHIVIPCTALLLFLYPYFVFVPRNAYHFIEAWRN